MESFSFAGWSFAGWALAAGLFFLTVLPNALRTVRGSVFEKPLTGMVVAGAVCTGLGLGGVVIAAVVGAPTVARWLDGLPLIGLGVVLLAVLVATTPAIRRRAARQRGEPH